mmetsp:Transcript_39135/g.108723  ORF Transcript_39135/g.108723 Transcript_39135/m.108723 type:complete len:191 (-) Transcript_39135:177-749(-)
MASHRTEATYRTGTDRDRHEASGYWQQGSTVLPGGGGGAVDLGAEADAKREDDRFATHRHGGALDPEGRTAHDTEGKREEGAGASGASHDPAERMKDRRFRALMKKVSEDVYSSEHGVRGMFKHIKDKSGDAGATAHGLWFALHRLGSDVTEAEVAEVVDVFDADRDGHLNQSEFVHAMSAIDKYTISVA